MGAIEAKRIKQFLKLEEHPGLEGLEKALSLRFYAHINEATFEYKCNKSPSVTWPSGGG